MDWNSSMRSPRLRVALVAVPVVFSSLPDSSGVNAMDEELENFERNQVLTLVDPLRDVNVIGTK
jgi:hypothetical protein